MTRRAPGEGSLYQDADGRWVGMASAGINPKTGKRRRVKILGAEGESKASVSRRLKARISELESTAGGPETVGELVALWRAREAAKRNSLSTLDRIDAIISAHIEPVWADVKLSAVSVDDVEAFLDARSNLSRSYLGKVKRVLSQSFQFGVRRRYLDWNPAQVAELPANLRPAREGRALTLDELGRLFNVARGHRNGAIVIIAGTLGLRVQETTALTWDRIDLKRGRLSVAQAFEWSKAGPRLKEPKTSRSVRIVDIPPVTVEALRDHRKT